MRQDQRSPSSPQSANADHVTCQARKAAVKGGPCRRSDVRPVRNCFRALNKEWSHGTCLPFRQRKDPHCSQRRRDSCRLMQITGIWPKSPSPSDDQNLETRLASLASQRAAAESAAGYHNVIAPLHRGTSSRACIAIFHDGIHMKGDSVQTNAQKSLRKSSYTAMRPANLPNSLTLIVNFLLPLDGALQSCLLNSTSGGAPCRESVSEKC